MILFALVERSLPDENPVYPSEDMIRALGLDLPFERQLADKVYRLSPQERSHLLQYFSTDRETGLSMVSFLEMMLSLFQETDSSIDGRALAFYQQREWRLIHHMRKGTVWYCLGEQPAFRDTHARGRAKQIAQLRTLLERAASRSLSEEYFRYCWLLESVDGSPIRDFITQVIVAGKRIGRGPPRSAFGEVPGHSRGCRKIWVQTRAVTTGVRRLCRWTVSAVALAGRGGWPLLRPQLRRCQGRRRGTRPR